MKTTPSKKSQPNDKRSSRDIEPSRVPNAETRAAMEELKAGRKKV